MNPVTIIARKRDGHALNRDEIAFFMRGFTEGSIPDYQMASLAMAIFLQGMSVEETSQLTREMLASGKMLSWPDPLPPRVDKHSTGGIGDKVSLILAPLLACCDLQVPMISGRGLGPTGGTLDKLESIRGFRTDLSLEEMQQVVRRVGCVINSASGELAPADRKLYALRDVTATVPSIPLITASIMSKKLAEGLDALVLDVKCGSGAFMKTPEMARKLAESLVRTGQQMKVSTSAMITDMNQPLGRMIGNAVEVDESVATLEGNGPDDLRRLTVALAGELLRLAGRCQSRSDGEAAIQQAIDSGAGREKLADMVAAQGGDLAAKRPIAPTSVLHANAPGYVTRIDTERLGWAVIEMGGGRKTKADLIDHSSGMEMLVRIGDQVEVGQPLMNLFCPSDHRQRIESLAGSAITIGPHEVSPPSLLIEDVA